MPLTAQYEVGTDQQVCVSTESGTYGTLATPVAADAQYFLKCLIKSPQEQRHAKDSKKNRSRRQVTEGHRNTEVEIEQYARGGEPADDDDLMTSIFEKTITTDTVVKSSGSISTTQFRAATPGNLAANTVCLWPNSDGDLEARFITAIDDTDRITVTPPFSGIPQDADNIYGCVTYSLQERQQSQSLSVFSKSTNAMKFARGFVPGIFEMNMDGSDDATQKFVGPAKDSDFLNQVELAAPMKANYGFSQNGATGDPSLIDATHKVFQLSARNATTGVMDAAEDCTLAGTESTWLAVVTYLNATAIPALVGTTNQTCVAVLIGTGNGTGMYIRHPTTGNGRDVLVTEGSVNGCAAELEMGEAFGGFELDADEMKVDSYQAGAVYGIVETDDEQHQILSIDSASNTYTVTREFNGTSAANHEIDADVNPYYPSTETLIDSEPISGIDGGVMINANATPYEIISMNITVDEKVMVPNKQIGKTVGDLFDRMGLREVSGSFVFEAKNTNLTLYNMARNKATLAILGQVGVAAGSVRGCYVPKANNIIEPEYDQGQDENNEIEIQFDAIATSTGGGDEVYFFSH
jgi:hypothetical protein